MVYVQLLGVMKDCSRIWVFPCPADHHTFFFSFILLQRPNGIPYKNLVSCVLAVSVFVYPVFIHCPLISLIGRMLSFVAPHIGLINPSFFDFPGTRTW